jgi:hypothetical protein
MDDPYVEEVTRSSHRLVLRKAPDDAARKEADRRFKEARCAGQMAEFDYATAILRTGLMYGVWPWGQR